MRDPIHIRIPATSANIGPGFDCVGLALDLYNEFVLEKLPKRQKLIVINRGEGEGQLPEDASHITIQALLEELQHLGNREEDILFGGWRLTCHNQVPCASGLGSSSTAILAGLAFAHALHFGSCNLQQILARAARLEGHADNVTPAVVGGMVVTALKEGMLLVQPIPCPPMRVVVCVPRFDFLTSEARALLPSTVSRQDAVFNIGRALLVVEALRTGNDDLLRQAMDDHLHQPYRLPRIPGAKEAAEAALQQGAAAVCISGAGPGLMAFARDGHERIGAAMAEAFRRADLESSIWIQSAFAPGLTIKGIPTTPVIWAGDARFGILTAE